jgi:hypothetical protein
MQTLSRPHRIATWSSGDFEQEFCRGDQRQKARGYVGTYGDANNIGRSKQPVIVRSFSTDLAIPVQTMA